MTAAEIIVDTTRVLTITELSEAEKVLEFATQLLHALEGGIHLDEICDRLTEYGVMRAGEGLEIVTRDPGECPKCHSNNAVESLELPGTKGHLVRFNCVNCKCEWLEKNGVIIP